MTFLKKLPCLGLIVLAAAGCSPGGNVAPSTLQPTITLSQVTVTCGTATVFGPASVSVAPAYGAGSPLLLSSSCPIGSLISVTFTPSASASTLGPNPELVFDLLPNSSTSSTAVAAADATSFTANVAQTGLPFSTPALGAGTYLYVWFTQLQPQGD